MNTLTKVRMHNLQELRASFPGFSCQGRLGEFVDKYLVCEAIAQRLLQYYCSDTKKKRKDLTLRWPQLVAAVKYFSINIEDTNLIKDIFEGGEGIRGKHSPRQLRNGYFHSLSREDAKEIDQRWSVLTSRMDSWLSIFS